MAEDRFTEQLSTALPGAKPKTRPRGPQTSEAAIERALRETMPAAAGGSGRPSHQVYVNPRYSLLLHTAWTNSDSLTGTKLLWQWERERRLYNLVASLHGTRFMVDGNDSRMIVDKDSKFTEQVVSLEFIDLAVKLKPAEFITRDPFDLLVEYGVDLPPYVDPEKQIAEVKQEVKAIKKTVTRKSASRSRKRPATRGKRT